MADQKLINLSKQIGIVLQKNNVPNVVAQVGTAFDISGSAQGLYRRGTIQNLMDRVFALAYRFDDNRSLEAWAFHTDTYQLPNVVESMFGSYVDQHILKNRSVDLWGGTSYLSPINEIVDNYFGATPAAKAVAATTGFIGKLFGKKAEPAATSDQTTKIDPIYICFVTDGETSRSEHQDIINLLTQHQDKPIFWQFIGLNPGNGSPDFSFLQKLNSTFKNVGFFDADNADKVSDEDLYTQMLNPKFVAWYQLNKKA